MASTPCCLFTDCWHLNTCRLSIFALVELHASIDKALLVLVALICNMVLLQAMCMVPCLTRGV